MKDALPSLELKRFRGAGGVRFEFREARGIVTADYAGEQVLEGRLVGRWSGSHIGALQAHVAEVTPDGSRAAQVNLTAGADTSGALALTPAAGATPAFEAPLAEAGRAGSVLFMCTGNFYRSRFAEHLFEALAERAGLDWVATSRGLRAWDSGLRGRMSAHSLEALARHGVRVPVALRAPSLATPTDFEAATRVIALDGEEHPPYVEKWLPAFRHRFEYWSVPDVDRASPDVALAAIEREVTALVQSLADAPR